jgi:hypothetical protein
MLTATIPLYDRNGLYLRQISIGEAAKMVDAENAEPVQSGGWRDRPDLEWEGVKLSLSRDYSWSPSSLTVHDMQAIVGAVGSQGEQAAARAKLLLWRSIH